MSFFRNLFGRRSGDVKSNGAPALEPPPSPVSHPASTPQPTLPSPAISEPPVPIGARAHATAPQAHVSNPQAHAPEPRAHTEIPVSAEDCIPVPLKAITDSLPQELQTALRKHPSEHVQVEIPRSIIQPQLASGAVRITFAQLRARTPEIFFHPGGAPQDAMIALPLDAILRHMMPSRRDDQRQPSIPSNIPSIFARTPGEKAAAAPADPWYTPRKPTYDGPGTEIPEEDELEIVRAEAAQFEPEPIATADSCIPMPAAPIEAEPVPAAPAVAESVPERAPERMLKMPSVPAETESILPVPPTPVETDSCIPVPPAPIEEAPAAPEPAEPVIYCVPAPPAPVESVPGPAVAEDVPAAPVLAPEAPATPENFVSVPLASILSSLPLQIRESLKEINPAGKSFLIPTEEFEPQMRSGKLRFSWNQLKGWCQPDRFATKDGDMDIDLPLAPLVPIFLASRKTMEDNRKRFEIDPRIPDVFGKSNVPAPAAEPEPTPIVIAQPAPTPVPEPEPVAVAVPSPEPEPAPVVTEAPVPAPAAEPTPLPEPVPVIPEPEPEPAPVIAAALEPAATPALLSAPEPEPVAAVIAEPIPAAEPIPGPIPFTPPAKAAEPAPIPPIAPIATPFPVAAAAPRPPRAEQSPSASFAARQPSAPAAAPSAHAKILQCIRTLEGVSGAYLATADGILIAADVPEGNENILAAFAPTVFSQLAKYSEMAHLGAPESIDLHLGATNIHVRKAGKIFLGVLTPHGRTLPLPELNLISAALQPQAS